MVAAADALRTIAGCGSGRLSCCPLPPPEPAIDAVRGPDGAVGDDSADDEDDAPFSSAFDVVHMPLAEITQVSESPARFAERTGTPLPPWAAPGSPASESSPAEGDGAEE